MRDQQPQPIRRGRPIGIETIYQILTELIPSMFYDLAKVIAGYIIARWIYEGIIMEWRYGGWSLVVMQDGKVRTGRKLSPQLAQNVLNSDNDLSVYVKGVVSFYTRLNMDICSPEARANGLLRKDTQSKTIRVDLDKNPPPKRREAPQPPDAQPGPDASSEG